MVPSILKRERIAVYYGESELRMITGAGTQETTSPLSVTLFGKPGCCLCDRATAALGRLGVDLPLEVAHVDITTDPLLFDQYRYRIPVVMADEEVLDEGKVTEFRLRLACERRGWLREQR